MIKISVIICTYNREEYILQSLDSIRDQSLDKSKYELVIINNNSTDRTSSICEDFITDSNTSKLNITYKTETRQGLSWARNRGIEESKGEVLIFLDDDAFASKDYLQAVDKYYSTENPAPAFGGKILPKLESEKPKWMSKFLMPLMSVIDLGEEIKDFSVGKYPIGANMGVKAMLFDKYGAFNTDLGRVGKNLMGGEEKDIFDRIRKNNHKIAYLPEAWVYHIVPDSRLTQNFIKQQGIGVGASEKVRAKSLGGLALYQLYFLELLKWGASLSLFLLYSLSFQFPKAVMVLKFRTWVSKGMFA